MATKPGSTLGEKLRDGSLYEHAPRPLRAQVLARLGELADQHKPASDEPRERRFKRPHWPLGWTFVGGGVTGAALCAAVLASLIWAQPRPQPDGIDQEIVASHVRALISARAIDVISTDQHTVKPWFNGRIDYAPPVIDTQAQGFPLVGGRLDYVGHRPVAVMIYRYLKHPLDLYVFPEKAGKETAAVTTESSDGYSIVRWNQNGMTFWAISDASAVYVQRFAEAIRQDAAH